MIASFNQPWYFYVFACACLFFLLFNVCQVLDPIWQLYEASAPDVDFSGGVGCGGAGGAGGGNVKKCLRMALK
jgi:hypothetical protein